MLASGEFDHNGAPPPFIEATLCTVPSLFERLIFAAALADPGGPPSCPLSLTSKHAAIFEDWLGMTVAQKLRSLNVCASGWGQEKAAPAKTAARKKATKKTAQAAE